MSHSQFRRVKSLYWDMHGLIFETSIWLLAGSTRLHLHTSTELRSSVACAQPDLFNTSLLTGGDYKTLSHTTTTNCPSGIRSECQMPGQVSLAWPFAKPSPLLYLQTRIWITPHRTTFSFGFIPNTVSELAAAIRMDSSHKTTPAVCQFNHSSFSASKPPGK